MEQQSISSFEHPPFSFSSNFFTYQLDFSLFSPLNLLKRCLKIFWQSLQETGRGEKKRKKTRMGAPSNVNTINWFISFFRERESERYFAVGFMENDSRFFNWKSKFCCKFQLISFILTSRLLNFLENSKLPQLFWPCPSFIRNLRVLLLFDFSLQN